VAEQLLADQSWPAVDRLAASGAVLAIPIGSTEQHGPHLPLSTDTDIAVALCERLAEARDDVLIAPAVAFGSSGEHAGFPGTLSIGQPALEVLLIELARSAMQTFSAVLFVSAHGGNAEPVTRATRQLVAEGCDVRLYQPRWEGDPHAGRAETSMMLALRPDLVSMSHAVPGDLRPLAQTLPILRARGVRAISESGILGDPTGATAAEGIALLDALCDALLREVAAWRPASRA
jgi:mycofactocin system creatininase family protein